MHPVGEVSHRVLCSVGRLDSATLLLFDRALGELSMRISPGSLVIGGTSNH